MAAKWGVRVFVLMVAAALVLIYGMTVLAAKPKASRAKPKAVAAKSKKPPPPPPVTYHCVLLGTLGGTDSYATDVNNSGLVVGHAYEGTGLRHAFRVIPEGDIDSGFVYWRDEDGDGINDLMEDLNTIPGVTWRIEGSEEILQGWVAQAARGVNESGQIVGEATNGTQTRPFRFDPATCELLLLWSADGGSDDYGEGTARDINDSGTAVGRYYESSTSTGYAFLKARGGPVARIGPDQAYAESISNSGHVVGFILGEQAAGWRYWPNGTWESLSIQHACGVNSLGTCAGLKQVTVQEKKKTIVTNYTVRVFEDPNAPEIIATGGSWFTWINEAGDVSFVSHLYTDEQGTLRVDDLIDPADWGRDWGRSGQYFGVNRINDRLPNSSFPQHMCGFTLFQGGRFISIASVLWIVK